MSYPGYRDEVRISAHKSGWRMPSGSSTYPDRHSYDTPLGVLTVDNQGGTPWIYAKHQSGLQLHAKVTEYGMFLHTDAAEFVCRSGDWLVLKPKHQITNQLDALLAWEKQSDGYGIYPYFVSGGSWLCTNDQGELNVKNQGEYAVMYQNVTQHLGGQSNHMSAETKRHYSTQLQ